jgi:hypothetical protein
VGKKGLWILKMINPEVRSTTATVFEFLCKTNALRFASSRETRINPAVDGAGVKSVRVIAESKFDRKASGNGPDDDGEVLDIIIGPVKPFWSSPRQTKIGSRP